MTRLLIALGILFWGAAAHAAEVPALALVGATVWDGTGRPPIADAVIE